MLEIYITDADINTNRIYVTAGIAGTIQSLGYSAAVYKPIEVNVKKESKYLNYINFVDSHIKYFYSYQLENSLIPILSAAKEGLVMEKSVILNDYEKIKNKYEVLITDGINGFGTPIAKNFVEEDIVKQLNLPVLFVVSSKFAKVNNVLLAINRAKSINTDFRGIIINDYSENFEYSENKLLPKLIEEYTDAKVLGILPEFDEKVKPEDLISEMLNNTDIEKLLNIEIAKLKK